MAHEVIVPEKSQLFISTIVLDVTTLPLPNHEEQLVQVLVDVVSLGNPFFEPKSALVANLRNVSPNVVTNLLFGSGKITFRSVGENAVVHICGYWQNSQQVDIAKVAVLSTCSSQSCSSSSSSSSLSDEDYESVFQQKMDPCSMATPTGKRRRVDKKKIKKEKSDKQNKMKKK